MITKYINLIYNPAKSNERRQKRDKSNQLKRGESVFRFCLLCSRIHAAPTTPAPCRPVCLSKPQPKNEKRHPKTTGNQLRDAQQVTTERSHRAQAPGLPSICLPKTAAKRTKRRQNRQGNGLFSYRKTIKMTPPPCQNRPRAATSPSKILDTKNEKTSPSIS